MLYPDYSAVHKKQVVQESDFLHRFTDARAFHCSTAGLCCISFAQGKWPFAPDNVHNAYTYNFSQIQNFLDGGVKPRGWGANLLF